MVANVLRFDAQGRNLRPLLSLMLCVGCREEQPQPPAASAPSAEPAPARVSAAPEPAVAAPERAPVPTVSSAGAPATSTFGDQPARGRCPSGMQHVAGEYCPDFEQDCRRWLDPHDAIARRCAEYAAPSRCKSKQKEQLDFCIDRTEFTSSGDPLPLSNVSWRDAKQSCERAGKRLCTLEEWTFACEGPEGLPYPYGFVRDSARCNIDRQDLLGKGQLIDHRRPVSEFPRCVSPFGVHNMTGNVGEWVHDVKAQPSHRSAGKGGWWGPLRNRCRATTGGHDEYFHQLQIGFRCCKS